MEAKARVFLDRHFECRYAPDGDYGSAPTLCGEYYVYVWLDRHTHEVFYVGKGHGNRWCNFQRGDAFQRELYRRNALAVLPVYNCSEKVALEVEARLIGYLGQYGHPLLNVVHANDYVQKVNAEYARLHPERFPRSKETA